MEVDGVSGCFIGHIQFVQNAQAREYAQSQAKLNPTFFKERPGRTSITINGKRCLFVYMFIYLSFIAARWAGRIGTNLIYSGTTGVLTKLFSRNFRFKRSDGAIC